MKSSITSSCFLDSWVRNNLDPDIQNEITVQITEGLGLLKWKVKYLNDILRGYEKVNSVFKKFIDENKRRLFIQSIQWI